MTRPCCSSPQGGIIHALGVASLLAVKRLANALKGGRGHGPLSRAGSPRPLTPAPALARAPFQGGMIHAPGVASLLAVKRLANALKGGLSH